MSGLLAEIKTRAYWDVAVRPTRFQPDRLAYGALQQSFEGVVVRWRGWEFPFRNPNSPVVKGDDYIEQENNWENHLEHWRLYQSGLVIVVTAMPSDWRERSTWTRPPDGWTPGSTLGIGEVLYRYSEILEFASRLSSAVPGDDELSVSVALNGLKGRLLVMDEPGRWMWPSQHPAAIESFSRSVRLSRDEVDSKKREIAAQWTSELLARFDKDISATVLRDWQDKFWRA